MSFEFKEGYTEFRSIEKSSPHRPRIIKSSILVVEDDYSTQRLVHYFLMDKYMIHFAPSIHQAKQIINNETINIILLDISLVNNDNGLDLVKYLRSSARWKNLAVVATTSEYISYNLEKCVAAGCMDLLPKPFSQDQLLEKINTWI